MYLYLDIFAKYTGNVSSLLFVTIICLGYFHSVENKTISISYTQKLF